MGIISKLVSWKKKQKYKTLLKFKNRPEAIQKKRLLDILKRNRTTVFGQQYEFGAINSLDDFRKKVPIRTSSEYKEFLQRMLEGNHATLCKDEPFYFAMTAGSTGQFKHIPINKPLSREIDNGVLSYMHLFESLCPEAADKPIQFLVGSAEGGKTSAGVPKGFVSGFHYRNLPSVIRNRFVIPYWVFTIEDIKERYYAMVRFLVSEPELVGIAAMTPQNICIMAKSAIENKDRLMSDMKNGTLTLAETGIYKDDLPEFKTEISRAEAFLGALNTGGSQEALKVLFPSMKYVSTWIGGNMSYALEELFSYFGEIDIFELPSSASEGFFVVPNALNTPGGIAAITCHFMEFIPEEQVGLPDPQTVLVNELEVGKRYVLVITTSGGLYRYNMEDLYEVTGMWGNTPTLRFISKQARQVSITNERINESDVVEAMNSLRSHFEQNPKHFILIPNREGYYDLVIDQLPKNISEFSFAYDNALGKKSLAYAYYREHGQIKPLKVHPLTDPSVLKKYVEGIQFRSNLPTGQFKPIHVVDDVALFEATFAEFSQEKVLEPF